MKHLVILDIDNIQEDYSIAMECISLLRDEKIEEAGRLINEKLVNKFYRIPLYTNNAVPRYFECPQLKNMNKAKKNKVNSIAEIYNSYYQIFGNYKTILFDRSLDLDSLNMCLITEKNEVLDVKIPDVILSKISAKENISRTQWIQLVKNNEIYYHIRIRVKSSSIYNLQYLALLLQANQDLVDEKKISVLLLNDEYCSHYFPFGDFRDIDTIYNINEAHKGFSRYLRLLAKNNTGIIFAPFFELLKEKNIYEPKIVPVNFKDSSIGENFFPLLEIDEHIYELLFCNKQNNENKSLSSVILAKDLYNDTITARNKYSLFQLGGLRFYNADSKNPNDAFLAYIAETSWQKLRKNWLLPNGNFDNDRFIKTKDIIVKRFTEEKNNWLTFAIFSFVFNTEKRKSRRDISIATYVDETYQVSRELSSGLQQLIQNSIQHSEKKSCYFTFYLDQKENNLHLSIIDINTKNTIIECFKERLLDEIHTCEKMQTLKYEDSFDYNVLTSGHKELIDSSEISLKHFFNIFDEVKEADIINQRQFEICELWKKFRNADSTAHVGLLIFYQAIIQCNADFMVQSSKNFKIDNEYKCRFVDTAKNRNEKAEFKYKDSHYFENAYSSRIIPGTQYQIIVPIYKSYFKNPIGEASISDINSFSEDYNTFAKYIDYKPKMLDLSEMDETLCNIKTMRATHPDEKFMSQLLWTNFWYKQIVKLSKSDISNKVFYWSVDENALRYLSENDNAEIFIKGLMGTLIGGLKLKNPLFIAIKNLDTNFIETLRSVCISLSGKSFCENLQIYFVDKSYEKNIQLFGNTFHHAVLNAIKLSIEHGSVLFRSNDAISVAHVANASRHKINQNEEIISVMPFDVIIPEDNMTKKTIFEARMLSLVEKRLDGADLNGYKLENTHMRLGNKVHIQSFYEMSFLFYRTTIANRIAFKIIRSYVPKLTDRIQITSNKCELQPILFYSYASYSKAILTSLVEITREYIGQYISNTLKHLKDDEIKKILSIAKAQVAFASYQHNLQSESSSDHIQLYFGVQNNFTGAELENSKVKGGLCLKLKNNIKKDIAVVLVVPISSTLTTFDKMFSKLKERVHEESEGKLSVLKLSDCYTAFWVREKKTNTKESTNEELYHYNLEQEYLENVDASNQIITVKTQSDSFSNIALTELIDCPNINYFMQAEAIWNSPLSCHLCFPNEGELIREVPLVETDLTSTVPSQQVRSEKLVETDEKRNMRLINCYQFNCGQVNGDKGNNYRLKLLRDCVYYGHIKRSKNHHQYYISTQDYFYKNEVQSDIRKWLERLQEKDNNALPKLKIIFSPEHNTNVGFAQYVNTYYFNGTAEIISVNEDKVFRSNFVCEHKMLKNTIERLHIQKNVFDDTFPVEFYFVDDTIITGATINKANNLLRSLLPEKYVSEYPAFLFKKCFILIDRLSNESKRTYTLSGNEIDFYSFVHIDISNMRTQGDSCIGCKLQNDAKKMFKRSASRITANYWANKYRRLEPINYDNLEMMETLKYKTYAYERLILSHISQNFIFSDGIITREKGEYYDCILYLFETILTNSKNNIKKIKEKNSFFFEDLLCDIIYNLQDGGINDAILCIAELLLKLLSRPFFSFDYSFKLQMQSFVLIITEYYLDIYSFGGKDVDAKEYVVKLSEAIPNDDTYKNFLLKNDRIRRTIKIAECFRRLHKNDPILITKFLKDIVFESLGDLRSTYLIRKSVIIRINKFINNYLVQIPSHNKISKNCKCWSCSVCAKENGICKHLLDATQCEDKSAANCLMISYLANIQRILECGSDEIKSVWFEYFLLSGKEINNKICISTVDNLEEDKQVEFQNIVPFKNKSFAVELFLTTASLGFDIVEKKICKTSETDYFLKNYYLSKVWTKQRIENCDEIKRWYALLSNTVNKHDVEDSSVPQIDIRYENFLNNMVNYVSKINQLDSSIFDVALLTMSKKEKKASIEKIQLVKDWFGKNATTNIDIKQVRYVIKDRVVNAFNNETKNIEEPDNVVGNLTGNGYQIVFADDEIQDGDYIQQQIQIEYKNHHATKNYKKPYLIIYFDNPDKIILSNNLGRKLVPLSRVFLYVNIKIQNRDRRNELLWIVLRDILTYRNRILRYLSEDFNGDLMEKHAVSVQEEAILTHERSSSHASTTDEKGTLRVFGVGNVSRLIELSYPIDVETKKIIVGPDNASNNYYSSELWLLLQNYVNGQIARLFSRTFAHNEEDKEEEMGIPSLYLSLKNEQKDDVLKNRLIRFSDIKSSEDNRFLLLNKAAEIKFFIDDGCHFFFNGNKEYYNVEYMRCVLLDIFFSAIKYATVDDALLPRVDNLMFDKRLPTDIEKKLECHIICFKDFDDLVILNNVKRSRVKRNNILFHNEEIYRRTHDPLDYGDGHMSLLTIRRFILGIYKKSELFNRKDTQFQYLTKEQVEDRISNKEFYNEVIDDIKRYDVWFETRLPIFLEED